MRAASFREAVDKIVRADELPMTPVGSGPYDYEGAVDMTDQV